MKTLLKTKKASSNAEKLKEKLLLHICCAGCGIHVSKELQKDFDIVLFFHNPNLYPLEEYEKRLHEAKKVAKKTSANLIISENNHEQWLEKAKWLKNEPEKGRRCFMCYQNRLYETAKQAQKDNFDYFATTLTISPHKNALVINRIGLKLADLLGIKFLAKDFKKNSGFAKSVQLSKKLGLYRQNYCGCEFSIRKKQ